MRFAPSAPTRSWSVRTTPRRTRSAPASRCPCAAPEDRDLVPTRNRHRLSTARSRTTGGRVQPPCGSFLTVLGPGLEAVPHLDDRRAEQLVLLAAAVELPALPLVEPPRARVVLEHPEDRRRIRRTKGVPPDGHQLAARAAPPRLRQDVDREQLALALGLP